MIDDSLTKNPALKVAEKGKVTKKEIWRFIQPYLMSDGKHKIFYGAMGLMLASKIFAVASPYFLKIAVNALANSQAINYNLAAMSIVGFGASRWLSSALNEGRMTLVVKIVRQAIANISQDVFDQIHQLDLLYHKNSSKTQIFAVNKAIEAIDNGCRFLVGFLSPIIVEFGLVSAMIGLYCGPLYLANVIGMLGIYTLYTKRYSKVRQQYIRKRFKENKKADFFLNESIVNFETV